MNINNKLLNTHFDQYFVKAIEKRPFIDFQKRFM